MIGSIAGCLAAAGLAMADGVPPNPLPLNEPPRSASQERSPESLPPVSPPSQPEEPKVPGRLNAPQATNLPPATGNAGGNCSTATNSATGSNPSNTADTKKVDLTDNHCGPCDRFWVDAHYLFWWTKQGRLPVPLLTGDSGVLLGDEDLHYGDRSGGRLTAGLWLDDRHVVGFELGGFMLERPTLFEAVNSNAMGSPALQRPITNALIQPPSPDTVPIAFPGFYAGGMTVSSASRLWGLEANVVRNLAYNPDFTVDLIFGFRYLDLDENLIIVQNTEALATPPSFSPVPPTFFPAANNTPVPLVPGSAVSVSDGFRTQNRFYGGQIGGRVGWSSGSWTADVLGKVALGPNHMSVAVSGSSSLNPAGGGSGRTVPGGILALPGANIGRSVTDWFSVAPEVGVQVGFRITENLRAQVGYSFLYLNNVVRPGDQVNTNINPVLAPTRGGTGPSAASGPAEPAPLFRKDDFWAHGINAGLTFRY
jgi:hypothetical protein